MAQRPLSLGQRGQAGSDEAVEVLQGLAEGDQVLARALAGRDGKHGYLAHLPRTLGLFVRALDAEAFGPLRAWLNGHVPGWRDELPPATLDALRQTPYRMDQGSAHDPL